MVRDILCVEFERQFLEAGEWEHVKAVKGEQIKYVLWNGSEIWLRQCDQFDRLRGPSIAAAWMDEAGQCPYGAFQILAGRLRQPGYPHLFMMTGTPRGKNWFHWCFVKGERPQGAPPYLGDMLMETVGEEPASFAWGSLQNPYLDPVTKGLLQSAYPPGSPMYRQEVLGESIAPEGLVYQQFDFDRHVQEPPTDAKWVTKVCGVDWGYGNPGVILPVAMDADGMVWVLDEVYEVEKDIAWWTKAGLRVVKQHGADLFYCDPSEPANIAQFRAGGLLAAKAQNPVIPGITAVAGLIAHDLLRVHPRCLRLIQEFGLYQWKERNGASVPDEPMKSDDHGMDALRYAVMALTRPSTGHIATG